LPAQRLFDVVPVIRAQGFGNPELVVALATPASESATEAFSPRLRFWNADRTRLVQLSEDLVVVNLVGTYPGWNAFQGAFETTMQSLPSDVVGAVESLALNTIDRIDVPAEGYQFGRYLNCDGRFLPHWYENSTEASDITFGRGLLHDDLFNRQINIRVRRMQKDFTIQIRSVFSNMLRQQSKSELLEQLHNESNKVFEALITDATRIEVMGGLV
jgi:uncharacterized protein (TIGR04255 family)